MATTSPCSCASASASATSDADIALAAVAFLVLVLAVAVLTGPRASSSHTDEHQQETELTPQQQDRVNERLNDCFDSGGC